MELFLKGGLLIWPILACSIVGTAIFFERLLLFRAAAKIPRKAIRLICELVREGNFAAARESLSLGKTKKFSRLNGPERLMLEGLSVESEDRQTLEMVLLHAVERETKRFSRYLGLLATLANIAPLLGLLGTVVGMIKAFKVVEAMGGRVNASVLAGGIWEAMLTTALGLIVAIPLILFHNYLENRLLDFRAVLEEVAVSYVKAWSAAPKG
ncbi:MAG: MotA/TolQ/ExbB proton channel family protein [Desulfuromonadales bacterium]